MTDWQPEDRADIRRGLAAWWRALVSCLAFLTRLPLPAPTAPDATLASAAHALPVAGLAVGLAGAAALALAHWLGLPGLAAALLAVAATVAITGGLHEDGLADTADGFGGAFERERKLAIMRDSGTGSFGVLALTFSVLLRAAALAALPLWTAAAALLAAHAASRAALAAVMLREPQAREDGLAVSAGRPHGAAVAWALAIAAAIALLLLGITAGTVALAAGAAAAWAMVQLARRQIGGYTGDVLGATQQAVEIVMLLAVAALG